MDIATAPSEITTAGAHGTVTAGAHGTATAGSHGIATAGSHGTAIAGYEGIATAGYEGIATVGDYGTATVGSRGAATAGHRGIAIAGSHGTATVGEYGIATAGDSGIIAIYWYDWCAHRLRVTVGYVGEDGIEPNTPYGCDARGILAKGATTWRESEGKLAALEPEGDPLPRQSVIGPVLCAGPTNFIQARNERLL